jgi:hypothetical protein
MNNCFGTRLANRLAKNVMCNRVLDSLFPGFGWNKKPIFNYVAVLDGYEFKGKIDYKMWDTGYINHDLYKVIEEWEPDGSGYTEEKHEVEIEFKFIEKEKKLFRSNSREVEGFKVIYNFSTGRWRSVDTSNKNLEYGYFNGCDFEMWFSIYQTDYDGDGIPFIAEKMNGTDPYGDDSKLDPDNDGIPTSWEWKWGYNHTKWDNHSMLDPDGDGLQNIEEYYMREWLANPFYPEIYIESDFMEKSPRKLFEVKFEEGKILPEVKRSRLDGWEHILFEETQQMLMDRFNEHGITVHIDDGCMGGGGDILPFSKANYEAEDRDYGEDTPWGYVGLIAEYYNNCFSDERKGIFRYLLIMHSGGESYNYDFQGRYDTMTIPVNRIFYRNSLNCLFGTPRMRRIGLAVQILHELGHTLGMNLLYHGGVDNYTEEGREIWKNYESVMSYYKTSKRIFDYSDGSHGLNDKDDWSNIDVGYFQRSSKELEGLGFDKTKPPFNR